jgi:SurA N-terminal domain
MRSAIIILATLSSLAGWGTIIDRTAIVVGNHVIKDSDIDKEIRITSFLNNQPPDLSPAARKQAASRLIDQELIREQIRSGKYVIASANETENLLAQFKKDRFANDAGYRRALARYGIAEQELKDRLSWQLTVLRFIDTRFRPAVVVSDEEIQAFYNAHRDELLRSHPGAKGLDDLKSEIEPMITGERINQLLDQWLADARKQTRIEYLEKSLQ